MKVMYLGVEKGVKPGPGFAIFRFKRFDNKFIRPYLVRDHCGAEPKILETYSKLAMKDALDYIRRNASTIGNISGTESMSAIFRNYSNTGQFNGRCDARRAIPPADKMNLYALNALAR